MNYGLYLSASGVLTNLHRQDVFANNLANVKTAGFKPDLPAIKQRDPEVVEDQLGYDVSQRLLDRLGGGALVGPAQIDFKPGSMSTTGRPLDLALTQKNQFFVVQATDPNTGQVQIALTRTGQFTRNHAGELVNANGNRVLDVNDNPIVLPEGDVRIDPAGRVLQDGELAAQLQVAQVDDLAQLQKRGQNLFSFRGQDPRQLADNPAIEVGVLENSGVDPITSLMQLIAATKAATSNAEMIRYHDTLMDRAVNTLGRIA